MTNRSKEEWIRLREAAAVAHELYQLHEGRKQYTPQQWVELFLQQPIEVQDLLAFRVLALSDPTFNSFRVAVLENRDFLTWATENSIIYRSDWEEEYERRQNPQTATQP